MASLANSRNNFGLLSSSQEPSQLIAQATNTAKNRKKREKSKGKKAAPPVEHGDSRESHQARDSNDLEARVQQAAPSQNVADFEALQRRFAQDAQNRDCWSVWDEWLRRVRQAAIDVLGGKQRAPRCIYMHNSALCIICGHTQVNIPDLPLHNEGLRSARD